MVFYEPGKTDHGLPRDPFKACVVPRPIGWISTRNKETGIDNLAPYSQFTNLTFSPPYVLFSANQDSLGSRKNTVTNAETSGEFCWNIATYALRHAVNATAQQLPSEIDEFAHCNIAKTPRGNLVDCPMVAESPVRFECKYHTTLRLPGEGPMGTADLVVGRVVGVHIDEGVLTDGRVDIAKVMPIARAGYFEYVVLRGESVFEMVVPGGDGDLLRGLEGNMMGSEKDRGGEGEGGWGGRGGREGLV